MANEMGMTTEEALDMALLSLLGLHMAHQHPHPDHQESVASLQENTRVLLYAERDRLKKRMGRTYGAVALLLGLEDLDLAAECERIAEEAANLKPGLLAQAVATFSQGKAAPDPKPAERFREERDEDGSVRIVDSAGAAVE